MFNSGWVHLIGGAYLGNLAYNNWISPKVPAGIANDLARAATVAAAVYGLRKVLGGRK